MDTDQQECRRAIKEVHFRRLEALAVASGFHVKDWNKDNLRGAVRAWVQDLTLAHPRETFFWSLGDLPELTTIGQFKGARAILRDARALRTTLNRLP